MTLKIQSNGFVEAEIYHKTFCLQKQLQLLAKFYAVTDGPNKFEPNQIGLWQISTTYPNQNMSKWFQVSY